MTNAQTRRRKREGVVYTPPSIVEHILRFTLEERWSAGLANQEPLRLLDPACGDGAFLTAACRRLFQQARDGTINGESETSPASDLRQLIAFPLSPASLKRLHLVRRHIFGVDVDRQALQAARRRLAAMVLEGDGPSLAEQGVTAIEAVATLLTDNVVCHDALADGADSATPSFLRAGAFQVIVANPPFVAARQMATGPSRRLKADRQTRFRMLQGCCDLYVLFMERIWELLDEGGLFGIVAPNRIALADYARRCRDILLTRGRLDRIDDISSLRAFPGANVYPIVLCGAKCLAPPSHRVRITRIRSLEPWEPDETWSLPQATLRAETGFPLRRPLNLETRTPTRPLGEIVTLHSGATGFCARQLANALLERSDAEVEAWDFITTGNIDRYRIRRGDVRFARRAFRDPVLPCTSELLTDRKRKLYSRPKIVLAGLCRRIEAAWSQGGLALGVQVYAASDIEEDPYFLLAVLNSKLMTQVFRRRLQAKRMNGGYLAINKGQLQRLPICSLHPTAARVRRLHDDVAEAAYRLTVEPEDVLAERHNDRTWEEVLENQIDAAVYELYGLSDREIVEIETSVDDWR